MVIGLSCAPYVSKMRILILILITFNGWCQTTLDYQIYSIVIEDNVERNTKFKDKVTRVLIFNQLIPNGNIVEYYGESFYELDDNIRYSLLFYDTATIKLIESPSIKEGLLTLEQQFLKTPNLDETKFNLKLDVSTIPKHQFDEYFKSKSGNKVTKGWKKFYRKNPYVFGIYGLSKIIYVDNYALFYMEHSAYGLFGSGDIIILQNNDEDWKIIKTLNIWKS